MVGSESFKIAAFLEMGLDDLKVLKFLNTPLLAEEIKQRWNCIFDFLCEGSSEDSSEDSI